LSFNSLSLGVVLGALVGWLGYQARALTASGAATAALIGVVIFSFGGLGAAILVMIFFISSSVLTRFKAKQKETFQLNFEKGGRRDLWQVLANGGIAAIFVMVHAWSGSPIALIGFVGAMAVATADTWGTEIGVLSQRKPRSILTGQIVPRGTSGGVTLLGTSATILGGLAIGAAGLLLLGDWRVIPLGMIGGVSGATIDSLLGARWQAMYFCPACAVETESRREHHCGKRTEYRRGWSWLNNDGVNLLATIVGAGVSVGLTILWI
jgi:uncharacterized protein (TIGR00297 family)